jgi:hypothetical protein
MGGRGERERLFDTMDRIVVDRVTQGGHGGGMTTTTNRKALLPGQDMAGAIGHELSKSIADGRLPATLPVEAIAEALERARVVAVLDGWAAAVPDVRFWRMITGAAYCELPGHIFQAPTPDAARALPKSRQAQRRANFWTS